MKIEIQDLLDGMDSPELTLAHTCAASAGRIAARTREKAGLPPQKGRSVRMIALLAAACLVLAGTAVAYTSRYIKKLEGKGLADTIVQYEQTETAAPTLYSLTASYFPYEMEDQITLREMLEFQEEQTGAALLGTYGGPAALLDDSYTSLCGTKTDENGEMEIYVIRVRAGAQLQEKELYIWGNVTEQKEGVLRGMDTLWFKHPIEGSCYQSTLLLYDPAGHFMIQISASSPTREPDFAELEKIAEGLELYDTGVDAALLEQDSEWAVIGAALG